VQTSKQKFKKILKIQNFGGSNVIKLKRNQMGCWEYLVKEMADKSGKHPVGSFDDF